MNQYKHKEYLWQALSGSGDSHKLSVTLLTVEIAVALVPVGEAVPVDSQRNQTEITGLRGVHDLKWKIFRDESSLCHCDIFVFCIQCIIK